MLWSPEQLRAARARLYLYRAGLVLSALFVGHALLVNALLWSGALGSFLGKASGTLIVDTGRSFSVWPGVVQLRQLHLEVIDSNVHLELDAPVGRANISLFALLRRHFSARDVTGEHFVLRLRPRFRDLPEHRQPALPPLSDRAEEPAGSEAAFLWPIRIQNSSASYDELWISELRYRGRAFVSGGFELVPQQRVRVDPSDVALDPGVVSYGPEAAVLDVQRLRLHAELRETPTEQLQQRWRQQVSFGVDLSARVLDVAPVSKLVAETEGLSGGAGDLSLQGAAREGQWVGDFLLEYGTPALRYARGDWRGTSAVSVSAATPDASSAPAASALSATVLVQNAQLDAESQRLAELAECRVSAELGRSFPLSIPHAAEFTLKGLALDGLEAVRGHLPLPRHFLPGGGRLGARASWRWQDERFTGKFALDFDGLRFAYEDWSFRQDGTLRLDQVSWRGPGHKIHLSGASLELKRVRLVHPDLTIDSWWVRTELERAALAPLGKRLRAEFLARGDDAAPVL
ncbi:MAG TPA: hypothetical protein VJU61_11080, partial [Polyangiaceae bacterium]|nr:hypothetical protein [Polyangiaceae bacterium]